MSNFVEARCLRGNRCIEAFNAAGTLDRTEWATGRIAAFCYGKTTNVFNLSAKEKQLAVLIHVYKAPYSFLPLCFNVPLACQ